MIDQQITDEVYKPATQKCGIDYDYNGKLMTFQCYAYSWEDAEARLQAIKETGRVGGFPVWTFNLPLPPSTPKPLLRMIGDILVHIVAWFKG